MKVLMLNGSPRANGNTSIALAEMEKIFREEGIEVENLHVGHLAIRSCVSCCGCFTPEGGCVFNDIVNEVAKKLEEAAKAQAEETARRDIGNFVDTLRKMGIIEE